MGSFYLTCSVSGMTLSRQKTSVLLLAPAISKNFTTHGSCICSNEGCQVFFSPFGFPIHGNYYDYGDINDIQRDENVEMLEEYFGIDIEDILANIGDDRDIPDKIKHKNIYKSLAKTYFRTEILEYLEIGWDKYNLIDPDEYSNGEFIKNLLKNIESSPTEFRDLETKLITKKINKTITTDESEILSDIKYARINFISYISYYNDINMFKELPIGINMKESILKQYTMLDNLSYEIYKNLIPSNYGSQNENWEYLLKFNKFTNNLLENDIEELSKLYDNDDDNDDND